MPGGEEGDTVAGGLGFRCCAALFGFIFGGSRKLSLFYQGESAVNRTTAVQHVAAMCGRTPTGWLRTSASTLCAARFTREQESMF